MKRFRPLLLTVCFLLCLSLLSACDLNGLVEWANSALEQISTDTDLPIWSADSGNGRTDTVYQPTDTDENTDGETPAAQPFTDHYTPSYGGTPVYIRKTDEEPLRYWRTTLPTQEQRTAYDSLLALTDLNTDTAKFTEKVTMEDVKAVYHLFMMDHPEIFWNGTSYYCTGAERALSTAVMRRLADPVNAAAMQQRLDKVVDEILSLIPDRCTDIEAEKIIFDWLVDNVTYDSSAYNAYSMFGALVDRRCVCAGYAEAFQYLCGRVGIPCFSVEGPADNGVTSERHKWNAVQIGGNWYLADVTWADGRATASRYLYFNESAYIASQRTNDAPLGERLPDLTATAAGYLAYHGLSFDKTSFDEAFLRGVCLQKDELKREYLGADVFLRADTAADAEWAKELLNTENDPRVEGLLRRLTATYGGEYILFSEAEIIGDLIVHVIVTAL